MNRFNIFFILISIFPCVQAITIGSDTAVTRFNGQTIINNGDIVAGFAALQGGFLANGSNAVWIFSSFFPVSGVLDFNNNTIALQRDFIVTNTATIPRLGGIYGNGYQFSLAQTTTVLPTTNTTSSIIYSNLVLNLVNDVVINSATITFTGLNTIIGNGNELSLNLTSTLRIAANSSLLLKNVRIVGLGAQNIQCIDSRSTLSLEDVTWIQDLNFTFSIGRMDVSGNCLLSGSNTIFTYKTDQPLTLARKTNLVLDRALTFSYDPTSTNRDLVIFTDSSSNLDLEGATLASTTTGLRLTKGTLTIGRASYLRSTATNTVQAVSLGDGITPASNIQLQIKPAASLEVLSGILVNNNI